MHKALDWQLCQRFLARRVTTIAAIFGLSALTGSITLTANAQTLRASNSSTPTLLLGRSQGSPTGTAASTPAHAPTSATGTAGCADVYFIGAHGIGQGPDSSGLGRSPELVETAFYFVKAKPNKTVVNVKYLTYPSVNMTKVIRLVSARKYPTAIDLFFNELSSAEREGASKLDAQVRSVLKACKNPKIVLVGYSLGAWVVDDWLSRGKNLRFIEAIELYGDPLWSRKSDHEGIARREGVTVKPDAYKRSPPGPGLGIAWQSLCLADDPVCGEGYKSDLLGDVRQTIDAIRCIANFCEHEKYAFLVSSGGNRAGYGLTKLGGEFLASQIFGSYFPPASSKADVRVLGLPLP